MPDIRHDETEVFEMNTDQLHSMHSQLVRLGCTIERTSPCKKFWKGGDLLASAHRDCGDGYRVTVVKGLFVRREVQS
jgi:hypothetical protein